MTKIVINRCHGGFSVSLKAARRMAELGHQGALDDVTEYDRKKADPTLLDDSERRWGLRWYGYVTGHGSAGRADPHLVQAVEELGEEANGDLAQLEVVEIPDDVEWEIADYDGLEWVAETHRTWP